MHELWCRILSGRRGSDGLYRLSVGDVPDIHRNFRYIQLQQLHCGYLYTDDWVYILQQLRSWYVSRKWWSYELHIMFDGQIFFGWGNGMLELHRRQLCCDFRSI